MIEYCNAKLLGLFGWDDNGQGKWLVVLGPIWAWLASHWAGALATPFPWVAGAWGFDLLAGSLAALYEGKWAWRTFWRSTYKLAIWFLAVGGACLLEMRHPEWGWLGVRFLESAIMLHEVSSGLKNLARCASGRQRAILEASGGAMEAAEDRAGKLLLRKMEEKGDKK